MNTILCPIDFSICSLKALELAVAIAQKTGGTLHLLHAHHFSIQLTETENQEEKIEAQFKNVLEGLERSWGKGNLPEIKTHNLVDFAASAISSSVKTLSADLVVMGTKGASGLESAFLGSIAEKVVSDSIVPILVVPVEASFSKVETWVYATDFREKKFNSLRSFCKMADQFFANVSVLHVQTPQAPFVQEELDQYEIEIKALVSFSKLRIHIFNANDVEFGISEFVKNENAGMLAMVRHRKNFLRLLLEKSNTRKMALHTHVPLIIFPE